MLQPRVTDLSHHNTITSLAAAAGAGLWGVIHKATQGTTYRDPTYAQRRQPVLDAGMLWGAYHFGDNSDPAAQVDAFLTYAKPGATTLLCLDYEDHPSGRSRTMSPTQMVAFLREIERRTGRKAALYSGNRIKEDLPRLSPDDRAYVSQHLLWLCQYGTKPTFPQSFGRTFLWQYTDGVVGPEPHRVPGITGQVDLNLFNGTRDDLVSAWLGPVSAKPARGSDDVPDTVTDNSAVITKPARGDDDTGGLPPFLRRDTTGGSPPALNVQPTRAAYSLDTEMLQTKLTKLGYVGIGIVDGKWGGKTRGTVVAFMTDRGKPTDGLTTDSDFTSDAARSTVVSEISLALSQGWSRPISPERANAKPRDLAPQVETVRVSLWGQFTAKIAAGFAAIGLTGSTVSDAFTSVRGAVQPVQDMFNRVPGTVWFLLMLIVALAVWYVTNRAAKAATNDYNTGRLN